MGLYLRKSIKVGPIRFNLSSSGVGVSAGIKGFRVGTGPRGNYVQMGRGGIYYRKTLSPSQRHQPSPTPQNYPETLRLDNTVGPMTEIESANVTAMADSSSTELLQEINEKKKKVGFGPISIVVAVACTVALYVVNVHPILQGCVGLLWPVIIYLAYRRDALAKTVVLFYRFDPPLERAYAALHEAASKLASCAGCWHISASARVYDRKYHAGASSLLHRKSTAIKRASPPFLKTNIETVSIGVGSQTMFLFPDRVLVYQSGSVGAISYHDLHVAVSQKQFIEDSSAPRDARVVGQTWRYVNKRGGPDRRFSNNRMLPVCLYDELHFTSGNGVNEIIQVSQCGVGDSIRSALEALAAQLSATTATPILHPANQTKYRIGRDGNDLGDLTVEIIRQMLSRGELSLQDYYFDFGTNQWTPLDGVKELISPSGV